MSTFKDHFNFLCDKYNLKTLYYKFIIFNYLSTIAQQSIYWCILLFSTMIDNIKQVYKYIIYVIILLIIYFILSIYAKYLLYMLSNKLKTANNMYFKNIHLNLSKHTLLNMNTSQYTNAVGEINSLFYAFISNIKFKHDMPIIYMKLIIISYKIKDPLFFVLGVIYFIYINQLYKSIYNKTADEVKKKFKNIGLLCKYIDNSNNLVINNNYNNNYHLKLSDNIEESNTVMDDDLLNLYMYSNIGNTIFFTTIIYLHLNKINKNTFYFYLMIIFDVLSLESLNNDYYILNNKINRGAASIDHLYKFKPENNIIIKTNKITNIVINEINYFNLHIKDKIIIKENDNILIEGSSGSGKTSLLYILKGIIKADSIDISPPINEIISQTFITLPNFKGIYSGFLYDIITNYNSEPDISLINIAIKRSKYYTDKNEYTDITHISAGELMRLYIARIIYLIKSSDSYNILLFDEIDQNLDDNLASEIYDEISIIFTDKIILYITHSDIVKKKITKKISFNGNKVIMNF